MKYSIREAVKEDLLRILEIYAYARNFMAETGNPNQWKNNHPPISLLEMDIDKEELYVICQDETIHGVFFFAIGEDPTYGKLDGGSWRSSTTYGTIHRIAGDGSGRILSTAVNFAKSRISHLRIDTHEDNKIMQKAVTKQGFQRRGIIYLADGSPRIAYDLLCALDE